MLKFGSWFRDEKPTVQSDAWEMSDRFMDPLEIAKVSLATFNNTYPFPSHVFKKIFMPYKFQKLYDEFPNIEWFESHQGLVRDNGQRSHNRLYLAYNTSTYLSHPANNGRGVVHHRDLSISWQRFIDELEKNKNYWKFISEIMGVRKFKTRYAWHMGMKRSEVSPHVDLERKIGTHIFYFNSKDDWNQGWGGATLLLSGKTTERMNPEFSEFTSKTYVENIEIESFLFKNMPDAWHGVEPLACPKGKYRKLFNVIFEVP